MHISWPPARQHRAIVAAALVLAHGALLTIAMLTERRALTYPGEIVWAAPISSTSASARQAGSAATPRDAQRTPSPGTREFAPRQRVRSVTHSEVKPASNHSLTDTNVPAALTAEAPGPASDSESQSAAVPVTDGFNTAPKTHGHAGDGLVVQSLKQAGKADKAVLAELNPWQRPPALHAPKIETVIGRAYVGGAFSVGTVRGPDGRTIGRSGKPGRYVCFANDTSGLSRARDAAAAPQVKAIPCPDWARH